MALSNCRPLAVAALVAISVAAFDANGQQYPTALEVAQLPRFCWAQYKVPNATGDQFKIQGCGPAMNHYCGGLTWIIRAKGYVPKKNERLTMLKRAMVDIRYTEDGMKRYPACPIRDHVMASKAEVLDLQKMYGGANYGKK
jgi:hypothetical protein